MCIRDRVSTQSTGSPTAMPLEIIGAGFGRTGTTSLKEALQILGYPTHHMSTVGPTDFPLWEQISLTKDTEERKGLLKRIFDESEYTAAIDFPAAAYWRELSEIYPKAKVILTIRDEEKWVESVQQTIAFSTYMDLDNKKVWWGSIVSLLQPPAIRRRVAWVARFFYQVFGQDIDFRTPEGRAQGIEVFKKNTEAAKEIVGDRLLVFEVKDGWESLCKFLGKEVPEQPFPRTNDTEQFQNRIQSMKRRAAMPAIFLGATLTAGLGYAVWRYLKK
eukprot:TRINITY_DN1523_c0_g1_i1.p1 TRINITY_DN1523_c0_g1~~TRINITY_DN1523_c0_g1_i1.p1  ORF type:complete len:274 (+),score=60.65 TRINITY_DN1523_c0_g1_i1:32-853(+)